MLQALISKVEEYLPKRHLEFVADAYEFAAEAHSGQTRKSGEPFITHPLETTLTLADLKLDSVALAAGLLHDTVEDSPNVSLDDIRERFGADVALLVDGVTKFPKAELSAIGAATGEEERRAQAETLRKLFMAMARDVRVVLIKLADRMHNMQTIRHLPPSKRIEKSRETLDIYAPLAHRLGIWEIKWRLEDMAFRELRSQEYKDISQLLNSTRRQREEYIQNALAHLRQQLERESIPAEVSGRPKHIYSIHNKIQKYAAQNKTVDDIHDLFALRVLVETKAECYAALGAVHNAWHPAPNEFDDYIANPKDNGYQSIHTAVIGEDGHPIEIQIRTREMHQLAEYGVAAHWRYKEGRADSKDYEENMARIRQLVESTRDMAGADEVVETIISEHFQDNVIVFTPLGDLKELPIGSTPLDFAFRVHSDLIFRCIGAKVNRKLVRLTYQLQHGDTCEILTSNAVRGPSLDWLNEDLGYVKTSSAKAKVRQWFKRQERSVNIQRGRDIFKRHIRSMTPAPEQKVAAMMGIARLDDFLAQLGEGSISVRHVVNKFSARERGGEEAFAQPALGSPVSSSAGIEVMGVGDMETSMARCCSPINGQEIVGYITRSRGVTIHRRNCPNVAKEDEVERLVEVSWGKTELKYPIRVETRAMDRVGLLKDITSVVAGENVNIAQCVSEEYDGTSIITLTVHVSGIGQLSRLFFKLQAIKGMFSVQRSII